MSLSKHEVPWRNILHSLVTRGLCGLQLVLDDDHAVLKAAHQTVFGEIPWQRCQFHPSTPLRTGPQQNA
ncbi:MAG: hypothetical protein B6D41_00905 [Chloroflexi bacterium UTCFX4]|jgi:transposase-like protein|nr:MAG: hypothetical protein B6D41_00905 [Chloroflexi bacterium UTCFX4]